ncbi:HPr family phosphocarrier protein [Anaerosacchariphilus polymeriproducens]|uniref:HPr family phosphocarrier protein n=1 Tax=Anaerosacchariphilus polymeriproducens TaxID=1812858 RepID=A0A371AZQ8_9FIRM|nr:HPr family phosphocarrier protein [Anaerosacchariphilus polymeriproducens]RDU25047.1 HPr family phosphocarrier protein [Anaerosacchariphilus polymeriproducens]
MRSFDYTITDPEGIHARPAGTFVKAAAAFACKITIAKADKEADAKRILAVMSLGVKTGETITITCDGADEEKAAESLESFLKENL